MFNKLNLMKLVGMNSDDLLDKIFPNIIKTYEQKEEITGQDKLDLTKDMANDMLTDGTAQVMVENMFSSGMINDILGNMFGNSEQ